LWPIAAIVHPPGLSGPEFSNRLYVKTDEEYFFFQGSPSKERVLRLAITPRNTRERLGIPRMGTGIIRHSYANHVVERSRPEPGTSDLVPSTGIRDHYQFRTVEHYLSCRLRKFSVCADHGAHCNLILRAREDTNVERVSRATMEVASDLLRIRVRLSQLFLPKITNEHLGIIQSNVTFAIDDRYRVAGLRQVRFEIRDRDVYP